MPSGTLPLTSSHFMAPVLSVGPWGNWNLEGGHSLLEIHTPVRADRVVSSPQGYESRPRLCSYLPQVGGHLIGRKGREGFLEQVWEPAMWERAGGLSVLFFYLNFKNKSGFNDRQGKMFIYLNTL